MTALIEGDCPCIRARKSPTDGRIIVRPDDDCSACHGTGTAIHLRANRPRNVRRVDARGRLTEHMREPAGNTGLWQPSGGGR